MPSSRISRRLLLLLLVAGMGSGCQRGFYRKQADDDAYHLTEQKTELTRAPGSQYPVYADPRSRMYDPFDPDHEPMPPDDPASHVFMRQVDHMKGWKHWHDNGDTPYTENPAWGMFLCLDEDGCLVLSSDEAFRVARINSRDYQSQLEELYLSALDVSFERFRFDSQFFLGKQIQFTSDGPERRGAGGQASNQLLIATLPAGAEGIRMEKMFAAGGNFVVGLANSLVWEFSGNNSHTATTLANFALIQPLLRNGGKARVLERLTLSERTLLANVRQMERYRRGFYVEIMTGEDAGDGPARRGGVFGSGLTGFTGIGGGGFGGIGGGGGGGFSGTGAGAGQAGGYMGLLQDQQNIRNLEFNVAGLQSNLARLRAIADAEHPDPSEQLRARLQVEQAEQALYTSQSTLLNQKRDCQAAVDAYKIQLGLPPELCVKIRDPMLDRFDLIDDSIITLQNRLAQIQAEVGSLLVQFRRAADHNAHVLPWKDEYRTDLEKLSALIQEAAGIRGQLETMLLNLREAECRQAIERRRQRLATLHKRYATKRLGSPDPCLSEEGEQRLQAQIRELLDANYLDRAMREVKGLRESLSEDLAHRKTALAQVREQLDPVLERPKELTPAEIYRALLGGPVVGAVEPRPGVFHLSDVVADITVDALVLSLATAKQRAMCIDLTPVELKPETAYEIARANRRDWMNARADLVNTWRLMQFNANDLRSRLDVVFEGDIQNVGDNPINLQGTTGRLRARLEFDAPLERLAERNNYRESLIEYQQRRRNYYAYTDQVARSLRGTLRSLEVNEINFEARRRAVLAAIDQVVTNRRIQDQPPAPGQVQQVGVTAARDAVTALSDLLSSQNQFVSVWVIYQVQRMALDRDLGTMQLDSEGFWIDPGEISAESGFLMPCDCDDCRQEDEIFGPPVFNGDPSGEQLPPGEMIPDPIPDASDDLLRDMGLRVVDAEATDDRVVPATVFVPLLSDGTASGESNADAKDRHPAEPRGGVGLPRKPLKPRR